MTSNDERDLGPLVELLLNRSGQLAHSVAEVAMRLSVTMEDAAAMIARDVAKGLVVWWPEISSCFLSEAVAAANGLEQRDSHLTQRNDNKCPSYYLFWSPRHNRPDWLPQRLHDLLNLERPVNLKDLGEDGEDFYSYHGTTAPPDEHVEVVDPRLGEILSSVRLVGSGTVAWTSKHEVPEHELKTACVVCSCIGRSFEMMEVCLGCSRSGRDWSNQRNSRNSSRSGAVVTKLDPIKHVEASLRSA